MSLRKRFSNKSVRWQSWVVLVFLSLTWGSSYILIKKSLIAFSPIQVASLRLSISALAFLPIFLLRFHKIDWSKWKSLLIVGLVGSGIPAFFFAFAQTQLNSSTTAVLSSLTPLMTFIIGAVFFNYRFKFKKLAGVLIGLGGALILALYGPGESGGSNLWYGLLVLIATIGYAFSSNVVGTRLKDMASLSISAVAFVLIAPPAIIALFLTDIFNVLQTHDYGWTSLAYVAILSLFGTVIASILFFKLVQMTSAVFASFVSYLIPIVALTWGFLDNETFTFISLTGMALILFGVYVAKERPQ